jgi:hypothetical protein
MTNDKSHPPAAGDKEPEKPEQPAQPRDKEQVDDEQLDSIAGGQFDPGDSGFGKAS